MLIYFDGFSSPIPPPCTLFSVHAISRVFSLRYIHWKFVDIEEPVLEFSDNLWGLGTEYELGFRWAQTVFLYIYRSPGIDSKGSIPPVHVALARIFKHCGGAGNRVGIGLLTNHTSCLLLLSAQFITGFLFGNLRKKTTSSANKF